MKAVITISSLAAILFAATPAWACPGKGEDHACTCSHGQEAEAKAWSPITVDELAALTAKKDAKFTVLDANREKTRRKYGFIPGATLLTSYREYNVKKELPSSKSQQLIFYCANQRCSASHKAAKRALEAGYTNVKILPDGILGWKDAGKPVEFLKGES